MSYPRKTPRNKASQPTVAFPESPQATVFSPACEACCCRITLWVTSEKNITTPDIDFRISNMLQHGAAASRDAQSLRSATEQADTACAADSAYVPRQDESPGPHRSPQQDEPTDEIEWTSLTSDITAAPPLASISTIKIFKLAKELRQQAALMTAGQDLHDIHTMLHLLAHWETLQAPTRNYAAVMLKEPVP
jgi:hypothetical protein